MLLILLIALAFAQQAGNQTPENHPQLAYKTCTKSGGCQSSQKSVVVDANWRWLHNVGGYTNCYTGNKWDTSICSSPTECAQKCALDGADYAGTYGVTTSGDALKLGFVTHGQYGDNIGSRLYLLDSETRYLTFGLLNKEFTFDVDVSNMPCGLNGALYFVEMDADGGMSKFSNNNAGAKYGTGYCDAQCPHDLKFINGEANILNWNSSSTDPNTGVGKYGTCCVEMDIWESNQFATAVTAHPCSVSGQTRCTDPKQCGDNPDHRYDGVCDKDGCDINPYRLGAKNFFGPGSQYIVDSTKKLTVVTQFITDDGTDNGNLKEIRRLYVQDGKVHGSPNITLNGNTFSGINDQFCQTQKKQFGDTNSFTDKGGMTAMGKALARGSMVLVLSIWDDHEANMLWLDSNDPPTEDPGKPGVARGPCKTSSGVPADVERQYPNSYVEYSNIRFGEIGSTYSGGPGPGPSPSGCPGGSLSACIGLCPSTPAAAYKACVQECVSRCS